VATLNFNIFTIIILAGIIQGLIFGFFLLSRRKHSTGNLYLAITVFSLALSNLNYMPSAIGLGKLFPILDILYVPFELLIIPAFYVFVNHYLEYRTSRKVKFSFVAVFLLSVILNTLDGYDLFFSNGALLSKNLRYGFYSIEEYFTLAYSLFLILLIIKKIQSYERANSGYAIEKVKAKTKWLKQTLYLGLAVCFLWLGIAFYMENNTTNFNLYYILWICTSFIIYWISYTASSHYTLLLERKSIRSGIILNSQKRQTETRPKKKLDETGAIFSRFEDFVQASFANPYLNIDDVAKELNISSNYLSQIISQNNTKFNSYLNTLRVESAKEMLLDETFSKYTIIAIGLEAGFNSKASFYRAFKTHTGKTPVEYQKSALK